MVSASRRIRRGQVYKILTLNNISVLGLERLPCVCFVFVSVFLFLDAILLRSFKMHGMDIPASVKAVGRAGAGVNNIPVDEMSRKGIPVFNAPGANANAVKELVIAGMLLAARNICQAWDYARRLDGDDASLSKQVEAGKKDYVGFELPGRTLGVIGLGAIGVLVANAAQKLGMKVLGYDPQITVQSAWRLSADVQQARSLDELLAQSDMVTFHVPLVDATRHMINRDRLAFMKKGVTVLNFAREGIVDEKAIADALDSGKMHAYVCDFPTQLLKNHPRVIALPHLGASTIEAEDNCAVMVADQLRDFLENVNFTNSVNFPEVMMPHNEDHQDAKTKAKEPNKEKQNSTAMAGAGLNIIDMLNKSKGEVAYTLIDVDKPVPASESERNERIEGVLAVRALLKER